MKDLSYLQAFSPNVLRGARRILEKGFTVEDINGFLKEPEVVVAPGKAELMKKMGWELKKPCGGCKDKEKTK